MRFRLGFVLGFGTGYYLGSMAGRERFEQINATVRKIKRSEAYEVATDKARDVVDTGMEKATDLVDSIRDHNGDEPVPAPPASASSYLRPGPPAS